VNHAPLLLVQYTPSGFERVVDVTADIVIIIMALAVSVLCGVLIFVALKVWGMIKRTRTDFEPAIRNVNAMSDTVKALGDKVRGNVEELSATVSETNLKVRSATEAAQVRLQELDALAGVVQAEAEEAFLKAASAVRGVQVGTRALRRLARRGGDEAYDGELDALLDDEGMDGEDVTEIRVTPPGRRGRHILD
jgi:hypothetical protein